MPRTHGSALFTRGQTQALTLCTLGTAKEEQRIDDLSLDETKRYIHHYNFPPYSVGETGFMRGPKRRDIGHGALAERALVPVIPSAADFPYTLRLVSEILESNGSSSMASVCGSTLSLMDAGVVFPDAQLVSSVKQLDELADDISYPVALKAMGLLHKSDAGGVRLGIKSPRELRDEYRAMVDRLPVESVTVEQMADTSNGVELIVGVRRDPKFGPVAVVGIGGLLTEVIEDVVTALAPVDTASAKQLLRTLRAAAVLDGVRGKSPVDIDSAAEQIAAIAHYACRHPELVDVEVNPLLATPSGAIALDARAIADETPDP
jgi:hypothetical protein